MQLLDVFYPPRPQPLNCTAACPPPAPCLRTRTLTLALPPCRPEVAEVWALRGGPPLPDDANDGEAAAAATAGGAEKGQRIAQFVRDLEEALPVVTAPATPPRVLERLRPKL